MTSGTAGSTGLCTNLPSHCSHAAQRTALPADQADARCPECGAALLRQAATGATAPPSVPTWRRWGVAVLGSLLVAAGGAWLWRQQGTAPHPGAPAGAAATAPAATTPAAGGSPGLRLHGSNTVGAALAPALLQAFLSQEGYDQVELQPGKVAEESRLVARRSRDGQTLTAQLHAHGSSTAFTDLGAGRADIGMSSRPVKGDEAQALKALGDLTAEGSEYVVALDGVAVVVHPTNPVKRLSTEQIRGLFSGRITDWKDVGAPPGPVHRLARDDKSGTFDTFKSLVMGKDKLAADTRRLEDSAALSDAVAADPRSIGFIGLPYVRQAKALAVSDGAAEALRPTRLTVATEDYVLSRRLFFYVPQGAGALARRFADFAVSDAGQRVADKTGFIGQLPEAVEAPAGGGLTTDYRRLTDGAQRLSVNLRFRPASMELDTKGRQDLKRIVARLEPRLARRDAQVLLLGFADNQGGDSCRNQQLSQERAAAVHDELATYGIRSSVVHGFGPTAPVASNETETGRERNRRVEVWFTSRNVQAPSKPACAPTTAGAARKAAAAPSAAGGAVAAAASR
jgi:phosphate transport system substrate-binding protein